MSAQTIILDDERPRLTVFSKGERKYPRDLTREEVQAVERATIRESFGGRVWPKEVWRLSGVEIPK